jgi:segregation and condensation protein B
MRNLMNESHIRNVIEAALLAAGKSLQPAELVELFDEGSRPPLADVQAALSALTAEYTNRGIEIKETAAGFRIQVRRELANEISRLWPERPARYSRALLETLALIAYRQPITRAEIEAVRGVAVNPNILKTVIERNWVRVVGHRDVPGRPELLGTTRDFLDYFGLRTLDELPPLAELKAIGEIKVQFDLPDPGPLALTADAIGTDVVVATEAGDSDASGPRDGDAGAAGAADAASAAEAAAAAVVSAADGVNAPHDGGAELEGLGVDGTTLGDAIVAGAAGVAGGQLAERSNLDHATVHDGIVHDSTVAGHGVATSGEGAAVADSAAAGDVVAGDAVVEDGATTGHVTSASAGGAAAGGATADGTAAHVAVVGGATGDGTAAHGAVVGGATGDGTAAHGAVVGGATGDGSVAVDAGGDGVVTSADGVAKPAHDAAHLAGRGSIRKKRRGTVRGSDTARHEAEEFAASVDADLAAGDDDTSDEDELSAAGPDSSELVAGPRDIDD